MNNLQKIIESTIDMWVSLDDKTPAPEATEVKKSLPDQTAEIYKSIGQLGATAAQMVVMSNLSAIESRHPVHGIFGLGRRALPSGGYHASEWFIIWIAEVNGADEHQALRFDAEKKEAYPPLVDEKDKDKIVSMDYAVFTAGKVALEIVEWLILGEDKDLPLVRAKGVSMSHDRLGERLLIDRMASWFAACAPERSFSVGLDGLSTQDRMMFKNSERRGWISIDLNENIPKVAKITWSDVGLKVLARLFLS